MASIKLHVILNDATANVRREFYSSNTSNYFLLNWILKGTLHNPCSYKAYGTIMVCSLCLAQLHQQVTFMTAVMNGKWEETVASTAISEITVLVTHNGNAVKSPTQILTSHGNISDILNN